MTGNQRVEGIFKPPRGFPILGHLLHALVGERAHPSLTSVLLAAWYRLTGRVLTSGSWMWRARWVGWTAAPAHGLTIFDELNYVKC